MYNDYIPQYRNNDPLPIDERTDMIEFLIRANGGPKGGYIEHAIKNEAARRPPTVSDIEIITKIDFYDCASRDLFINDLLEDMGLKRNRWSVIVGLIEKVIAEHDGDWLTETQVAEAVKEAFAERLAKESTAPDTFSIPDNLKSFGVTLSFVPPYRPTVEVPGFDVLPRLRLKNGEFVTFNQTEAGGWRAEVGDTVFLSPDFPSLYHDVAYTLLVRHYYKKD